LLIIGEMKADVLHHQCTTDQIVYRTIKKALELDKDDES
jgi:hypothetical protein